MTSLHHVTPCHTHIDSVTAGRSIYSAVTAEGGSRCCDRAAVRGNGSDTGRVRCTLRSLDGWVEPTS